MRVKYFGHACFLLADNSFSILIDPHSGIGYELNNPAADFCICSHQHFDHNAVDKVIVKKVISENDYFKFPWLKVINSFHDEVSGAKRGNNNVIVVNIGGYKICHLGDLGEPLNKELCKKIGSVDVLLIPIGGVYTINSAEALEYVKEINPKIVIPMHYKTRRGTVDVSDKDEFLKMFNILEKKNSSFDIDNMPKYLTVYDINDEEF